MSDAIICAIIAGICAVIGQFIISKRNAQDLYAKLDKQSELADEQLKSKLKEMESVITLKIDTLEKRVDKHNGFGEKIPVLEEKISVANHRISDLEKKVG